MCFVAIFSPVTVEGIVIDHSGETRRTSSRTAEVSDETVTTELEKPTMTLASDYYQITVSINGNDPVAEGYQIHYSTNKKTWKNIGLKDLGDLDYNGSVYSYKHNGLGNKKLYYYRVRSFYHDGQGKVNYSTWSAVKSIKTKNDTSKTAISLRPSTVPGLQDKTSTVIEIELPQHDNLVSSKIYRGTSSKKIKTLIATVPKAATTYNDTSVIPNKKYYYKVVSTFVINGKTVKKTAPVKSRKTAPIDMAMPKAITVESVEGGVSIDFTVWNNSTDYSSVNYYRSTNNKTWKKIDPVAYGGYDHVDQTFTNKKYYYYKVELVKNGKKVSSGSKKIKSTYINGCGYGDTPYLSCDAVVDTIVDSPNLWGVYPSEETVTIAGDAYMYKYLLPENGSLVDGWIGIGFANNGGKQIGYVLFMYKGEVFIPPPPEVIIYNFLKE